MKNIITTIFVVATTLLTACSTDYTNVLPKGSKALLAIDLANTGGNSGDELKKLLHIDNVDDCGIDIGERIYAFEAADGTFGLLAKVSDEGKTEQWLTSMANGLTNTVPAERHGYKFCVVYGAFAVGLSDNAMLVMGPAVGTDQDRLQQRMAKMLKGAEENSATQSELFAKLEEQQGVVCLAARADALPDKLSAPLTLGAPKGTASDAVCIAASMGKSDGGVATVIGETFSFNPATDKALREAANEFSPVSGKYLRTIPSNAMVTMACGANGEQYIKRLQGSDAFRTVLMGLNTTIDIDKMLKSVKGDMVMAATAGQGGKPDIQFIADTKDSQWLHDVDYWKRSCPDGTKITNWHGDKTFHLGSSEWNVYFGLDAAGSLFFNSDERQAETAGKPAQSALPPNVIKAIEGKRLCLVVGVDALVDYAAPAQVAFGIVKAVLGDTKYIVYSIK